MNFFKNNSIEKELKKLNQNVLIFSKNTNEIYKFLCFAENTNDNCIIVCDTMTEKVKYISFFNLFKNFEW